MYNVITDNVQYMRERESPIIFSDQQHVAVLL
jgi:hypothetical protein